MSSNNDDLAVGGLNKNTHHVKSDKRIIVDEDDSHLSNRRHSGQSTDPFEVPICPECMP